MKRLALIGLLMASSCKPDLGERDSLISSTRLVAVTADPAEAKPGATVVYRALVASPAGLVDAPLIWSFCGAPKAITDNDIVSSACLGWLTPFGGPGLVAAGVIPEDACARFGPDAPPGGFRPRDADITGGYYQPVRATLGTAESFALQRVTCNLANTSADNATEFGKRYVPNSNPKIAFVTASIGGARVTSIPPGSHVDWQVGWAAEDAETYVRLNPQTQLLEEHRESLRVSWFSTAGTFESDRTGREESDLAITSANAFNAPAETGTLHVFVVLRDSRGGSTFTTIDIGIEN